MARLWRLRWVRLLAGALAFATVTVFTYLVAHPRMFTGFAVYDDEGYMLVALNSFIDHGSLYDDVFTQYGPFYYEAWGALYSVLGLAVDHENGRIVTTFVWVLTSLTIGLATWRMTRSVVLGLATQMLVFGAVGTVVNEPMHPGGILILLLAVAIGISCLVRERSAPLAMAALGGVVAALTLVKINVGAFALASLALACVATYSVLAGRRWIRIPVEVAFVAIPLLLVTSKLDEAWARHYGVHVAVAALALVIALRARDREPRSTEELWWLAGGLIAVGLAACFAILAAGTTPAGLIDGVIGQPLRQPDAFSIALGLSRGTYALDFVALAAACGYWYVARGRTGQSGSAWIALTATLSIAIGVTMALSVIGRSPLLDPVLSPGYQLAMLSFAWVALAPPPGAPDRGTSFARLLLPVLAVPQALHAFPVAAARCSGRPSC